MARILPIFSQLFDSLGLELPLPTRALLAGDLWFLPAVFAFGAVLSIANGFFAFSNRQRRIAYVALALIGVLPLVVTIFLYLPLFVLSAKLKGIH